MLTHIVLFQFKVDAKGKLPEALEKLNSMVGKVEVIESLEAGLDILHSGRSYDLGLVVRLKDRASLEIYDQHKDHVVVKQFLAPLIEKSVAVDFVTI